VKTLKENLSDMKKNHKIQNTNPDQGSPIASSVLKTEVTLSNQQMTLGFQTKNCICTGTTTDYQECYFEFECNNSSVCKDCSGAPSSDVTLSSKTRNKPVKILLYNNVEDDISIYKTEMVKHCSVPCEYTKWDGAHKQYDGIVFSVIKYDMGFPEKPPHQKWIAHCGGT
jgi:hypothetical protein